MVSWGASSGEAKGGPAVMRTLLLIVGLVLLAFGTLFTLQGLDIIRWPPDSFMLGKQAWVTNGSIIAVIGAILILLSRRGLRR